VTEVNFHHAVNVFRISVFLLAEIVANTHIHMRVQVSMTVLLRIQGFLGCDAVLLTG
jgi:hypothetical protein